MTRVLLVVSPDLGAGAGQARLGAERERVEGEVRADREASGRAAPGGGEETHRGDPVPQAHQHTAEGSVNTRTRSSSSSTHS